MDEPAPILPGKKDLFAYLRMGLVTGLVSKDEAVAWADQALLESPVPDYDFVQLSLASRLSLAQMVELVSRMQGEARYGLPLGMLFARAGRLLTKGPHQSVEIIQGIRLLRAEVYLPPTIRQSLLGLEIDLDTYRQNRMELDELSSRLAEFLEPYAGYLSLVERG
ncbi:MAG TPA: hypothetical protein VF813_05965 [Anaerolineaceae bacterium]